MIQVDTGDLLAVSAQLTGAPRGVARRVGRATAKAANDIAATARQTAPIDTGFLRSSISTSITGGGGLSAEVGPTAHYGAYLEYGTRFMSPRPYMRPAADRHIPGWQAAVGQAAAEGIL